MLLGEFKTHIVDRKRKVKSGISGLIASENVLMCPVLSRYDTYMLYRIIGKLETIADTYKSISNIIPAVIPPGSVNCHASYPQIYKIW